MSYIKNYSYIPNERANYFSNFMKTILNEHISWGKMKGIIKEELWTYKIIVRFEEENYCLYYPSEEDYVLFLMRWS